ncbi:MAG TPA: hypothetical protein VGT24_00345 [Candidatus Acidoferrales bacterium]|nr:hypothetical protein [Candidatus Acidoferrales bacterium]
MSFLHPVLSLPPGVLLAVSGILIVLFALWLSALFSRRHIVTIKRSEETELIAFELRRIADAVERIASVRETQQVQPSVEAPAGRTVGLSMFGR